MSTVFAEVPDFGFGPAASFADLALSVSSDVEWVVATAGNAAAFLKLVLPSARFVEFNGFDSEAWPEMASFAPPESLWLSMSNPRFSDWAGERGHPVILVDQLYWMWGPAELGGGRYTHVGPWYFREDGRRPDRLIPTRPLLDKNIERYRTTQGQRHGTLIAFGGMAVAGQANAGDKYARWFLDAVIPDLLAARAIPIYIAGGSPNLTALCSRWARNTAVIVVGALNRHEYLRTLAATRHQLLTPGLSTIYESAELNLRPMFGPGANKSMVLQLDDLASIDGRYCASWTWAADAVPRFRLMPQIAALAEISVSIDASLGRRSGETDRIRDTLSHYLHRGDEPPLSIGTPQGLPEIGEVVGDLIVTGGQALPCHGMPTIQEDR